MKTRTIILAILVSLASSGIATASASAAEKTEADKLQKVAACNDGKDYYNTNGHHMGACRGHGGVASWANGAPVKSKTARTSEYR